MESSEQRSRHLTITNHAWSSGSGSLEQLEQYHAERVRRRLVSEPCPHEGDTPSSRMAARGWQELRNRSPIIDAADMAEEPVPGESSGGTIPSSSPWTAVGKRFVLNALSILRRRNSGQPTAEMSEGCKPKGDRPSDRASAHPSGAFTAREEAHSARRSGVAQLGKQPGSRRDSTASSVRSASSPSLGQHHMEASPHLNPTPIGERTENGDTLLQASAKQTFAPPSKRSPASFKPHSWTGRPSSSSIDSDARGCSWQPLPRASASDESSDLHSDSEKASTLVNRRRSCPRRWGSDSDGDTGRQWPLDLLPYLGYAESAEDTAGVPVHISPQHTEGGAVGPQPPLSVEDILSACAPPDPGSPHPTCSSSNRGSAVALIPAALRRTRSSGTAGREGEAAITDSAERRESTAQSAADASAPELIARQAMTMLQTPSFRVSRLPSISLRSLSARSSIPARSPTMCQRPERPPGSATAPSGSLSAASSTLTLSLPSDSTRGSNVSGAARWSACSAGSAAHAASADVEICLPETESPSWVRCSSSTGWRKRTTENQAVGGEVHGPVRAGGALAEGVTGDGLGAGAGTARGLLLRHAPSAGHNPPPPSTPPPPMASTTSLDGLSV